MEYVRLGNTGLKVSRICLGTMTYGTSKWRPWVLDESESRPFIKRALEHGINFFDTADMYSRGASEQVLGRALKDFAQREQVVIATKAFYAPATAPTTAGCHANICSTRSTRPFAVSAPTTWICTRSIASITTRPS